MPAPRDRWFDGDAGPFVRPYAVTRGRTAAAGRSIGLIDVVVAVPGAFPASGPPLGPEHRQLLSRCRQPAAVVDLASDVNLPVGVVRVLLGDLGEHGLVRVMPANRTPVADHRLLSEVLDGLRGL